jgi:hypothetical protein
MQKFTIIVGVVLCALIVRTEMVLRNMQQERHTTEFVDLTHAIQVSGEPSPTPTPKPRHEYGQHVTQRIGQSEDTPTWADSVARVLEALGGGK